MKRTIIAMSCLLLLIAFGCPLIRAPLNAWTRTNGQYGVVQCNSSSEAWYLTCKGTQWVGEIGNCSMMYYSSKSQFFPLCPNPVFDCLLRVKVSKEVGSLCLSLTNACVSHSIQ